MTCTAVICVECVITSRSRDSPSRIRNGMFRGPTTPTNSERKVCTAPMMPNLPGICGTLRMAGAQVMRRMKQPMTTGR